MYFTYSNQTLLEAFHEFCLPIKLQNEKNCLQANFCYFWILQKKVWRPLPTVVSYTISCKIKMNICMYIIKIRFWNDANPFMLLTPHTDNSKKLSNNSMKITFLTSENNSYTIALHNISRNTVQSRRTSPDDHVSTISSAFVVFLGSFFCQSASSLSDQYSHILFSTLYSKVFVSDSIVWCFSLDGHCGFHFYDSIVCIVS